MADGKWELYEIDAASDELKKRNISISEWSRIGEGSSIGKGSSIGEGSSIGKGSRIGEGSKITKDTILVLGPLGSRDAMLTIYKSEGILYAGTGCYIGTLDDFEACVKKVHKDTEHARRYLAAVKFGRKVLVEAGR